MGNELSSSEDSKPIEKKTNDSSSTDSNKSEQKVSAKELLIQFLSYTEKLDATYDKIIIPLIKEVDNISTKVLKFPAENVTEGINQLITKIEAIRTGSKEADGHSNEEVPNPSINSLNSKLDNIAFSSRYNNLFFILPPCILLAALLVLGFFVKPPSMDSVNERIEKLSINITENSPKSQINKLKDDITGIKNSFDEVNKKGVSEIKELIAKTGNLTTLSENINALKTSVDKLSTNPLNKKDLDDIKIALKTLGDNKSTTSAPQFIGQLPEASKFAKELLAELIKSKGFTDEIAKSSNQATKEALKSVDDKIKLISDSIKINPKTDKTEDILKSIDGNFKSILESINKNPKQVISKPNHPFLLICSTTPTFNPFELKKLKPLFEDLTKTIRETNRNIDLKIGLEYSSNFIPWFDNEKITELSVDNFGKAEPVFSSNFLNGVILAKELKNNILSDLIIIVPLGTGGGLKTNGGTPIFMNGVRVHVIYLALAKEKNTITESMLGWSKFAATNGGGTFSVLTIIEGPGGKPNEEDLAKQVKDHVLKLVQKFSY